MSGRAPLQVRRIDLADANAFVAKIHRHHEPTHGHKFSIAVYRGAALHGVAIVGRPVARLLDDNFTLEVTRVATDGEKNACSILYGACARAAEALGFARIVTYTLESEGGVSLRASGWTAEATTPAKSWNTALRPRDRSASLFGENPKCAVEREAKTRWAKTFYVLPKVELPSVEVEPCSKGNVDYRGERIGPPCACPFCRRGR